MRPARPVDAAYKLLFANRRMVEDAVRLVAPRLGDELAFDTTTGLDKEHLGPLAQRRFQDSVARIERKGGVGEAGTPRSVLVLFEFQSEDDPRMAWRMHEYQYLVELSLRQTGAAEAEAQLPDLLPVVVHNGDRPWRASNIRIGPIGPRGTPQRTRAYATVDLRRLIDGRELDGVRLPADSRLATLAALESAATTELPGLLAKAFERHGEAEAAGWRRGLHLRVQTVLQRADIGELPPFEECERTLAQQQRRRKGTEMTGMLEATVRRWRDEQDEQIVQSRAEGVVQGRAEGVVQGRVALLRRQAERRFGADTARRLAALLTAAPDAALLDEAGDWLLDCRTGADLLARLSERTGPEQRTPD